MNQKEAASRAFQNCGVLFQVCKLSVGDYLWVCKPKKSSVHVGCDLVLPFVIERKRLDDLAGSIKDGRFKEQKVFYSSFNISKRSKPSLCSKTWMLQFFSQILYSCILLDY